MSYGPQPAYQPRGTFPCPRCGAPVRQGAASCPNCNTPLSGGPAPPQMGNPAYAAPYGYGAQAGYHPQGAYAQSLRTQKRAKAKGQAAVGGLLLVAGLGITLASMAAGGGGYILMYGLILVGLVNLVKGLAGMA